MALENSNLMHAAAQVTAQVGPVFPVNRGFTTVVRNGAGDYTLTLEQEVDALEAIVQCNANAALAASGLCAFGVTRPTDASIRITTLVEGAAGAVSALTDISFTIHVFRLPTG